MSAPNGYHVAVPGSIFTPRRIRCSTCSVRRGGCDRSDQMLVGYRVRRDRPPGVGSDALNERGTNGNQRARSSADRASDFGLPGRMLYPSRLDGDAFRQESDALTERGLVNAAWRALLSSAGCEARSYAWAPTRSPARASGRSTCSATAQRRSCRRPLDWAPTRHELGRSVAR